MVPHTIHGFRSWVLLPNCVKLKSKVEGLTRMLESLTRVRVFIKQESIFTAQQMFLLFIFDHGSFFVPPECRFLTVDIPFPPALLDNVGIITPTLLWF
jgi:hypothetical protein